MNYRYQSIFAYNGKLDAVSVKKAELNELENLFELNVSAFRDIGLCRAENKLLKTLWDMMTIVYAIPSLFSSSSSSFVLTKKQL